jgi:ABC-type uncharacterized transport system substrate-binding protein
MLKSMGFIIFLALGIFVVLPPARAQSVERIARIGVLLVNFPLSEVERESWPFVQGLRELGWVEGKNIAFEWRFAEENPDRLPALAADLVHLKVDLIVAGASREIRAAQHATSTMPIVMLSTADPVGAGFVASLARPGGNITGLSSIQTDLIFKWVELLKEAVPGVSRVAVLADVTGVLSRSIVSEQERVARALGVQLHLLEVADPSALEPTFATITNERADALMVLPSPRFHAHHQWIVGLVARSQLPAIYPARWFVETGGLMSYDRSRAEDGRRAASYVDRILKGAKPGDLPVEQPMKFELVINLKTAQALGLTLPPALLFQADEVIR